MTTITHCVWPLSSSTPHHRQGPGQFYTGQSDTLNVTARYLATGSSLPPVATVSDVIDSGCAVKAGGDDKTLVCYVVRPITPSSAQAPYSIDLASEVQIAWAHGPVTAGAVSYHGNDCGTSTGNVSLPTSGPKLSSYTNGSVAVSWTPLPADQSVDVYLSMDLSTKGMTASTSWIGVGLGGAASAGTMGPAEFFTGQGNTLVVTDRYLNSGTGYPPPNNASDLTASSCALSGSSSSVLSCSFSRPLQTTASDDQVSVLH